MLKPNLGLKWHRIWALVLRYLYATRDPTRIAEFIFWPMVDIGFLGLIAFWAGSISGKAEVIQPFITGLVLWQLIYRANAEICLNIMDEFFDQNLTNLISTPLTRPEWIVSMMFSGLIKIIFTLFYGALIGWLFFGVNVFAVGSMLVPFIILCLLSGWMTGFLGGGILMFKGSKFPQLPWVMITIAALLSTIFYPLEILPQWLKYLSLSLPMAYIFETMRQLITQDTISLKYLILSFCLAVFYLSLSIGFFLLMFKKSRNKGFSRLS